MPAVVITFTIEGSPRDSEIQYPSTKQNHQQVHQTDKQFKSNTTVAVSRLLDIFPVGVPRYWAPLLNQSHLDLAGTKDSSRDHVNVSITLFRQVPLLFSA